LPFCHLAWTAPKPDPKRRLYPRKLKTLGDHIRNKRLERGLSQREAAKAIGVEVTTLRNWEANRTAPRTRYLPAVIGFLGYTLFEPPASFGDWLRLVRRSAGMSQRRFAAALGVDPSTVQSWERGRHRPTNKSVRKVAALEKDLGRRELCWPHGT
jgi:transcriptional regulator with XRE-family HTH domain